MRHKYGNYAAAIVWIGFVRKGNKKVWQRLVTQFTI